MRRESCKILADPATAQSSPVLDHLPRTASLPRFPRPEGQLYASIDFSDDISQSTGSGVPASSHSSSSSPVNACIVVSVSEQAQLGIASKITASLSSNCGTCPSDCLSAPLSLASLNSSALKSETSSLPASQTHDIAAFRSFPQAFYTLGEMPAAGEHVACKNQRINYQRLQPLVIARRCGMLARSQRLLPCLRL